MAKKLKGPAKKKDEQFPLPEYAPKDDIYKREKGESLEKDEKVEDDNDLDIPGAELDDENEIIGEEDEENNYYSLGGDNHEDLEETHEDQ